MLKAIDAAKKIIKSFDESGYKFLEEVNLHKIFDSIYDSDESLHTCNAISSFVILAYDNDSSWLNLKQDRVENKTKILKSITPLYTVEYFRKVIHNDNSMVNDIIASYLEEQATWKWRHIMTSIDFHSTTLRFVQKKIDKGRTTEVEDKDGEKSKVTEEYDIDLIAKVGKQKGDLLKQALEARASADNLLAEIRKEFVQLDHVITGDFGFSITDEKKIDPMIWRSFIKDRNGKKSIL